MYNLIDDHHALFGATGGRIKSSASAILFFWMNWQYYAKFHRLITITEVYKNRWHGENAFGTGDWNLMDATLDRNLGVLKYFQTVSFASLTKNAVSIFRYTRISKDTFWYCGGGFIPIQGAWKPLKPLISMLGKRFLVSIGDRGGRLAAQIWQDENLVFQHCGPIALEIYREMQRIELDASAENLGGIFSNIDSESVLNSPDIRPLYAELAGMVASGVMSTEAEGLFRAGLADFVLAPVLGPFSLREAAIATVLGYGRSRRQALISPERHSTLGHALIHRDATSEELVEACRQMDVLAKPIQTLLPTHGGYESMMLDRCHEAWKLAIQIAKVSTKE